MAPFTSFRVRRSHDAGHAAGFTSPATGPVDAGDTSGVPSRSHAQAVRPPRRDSVGPPRARLVHAVVCIRRALPKRGRAASPSSLSGGGGARAPCSFPGVCPRAGTLFGPLAHTPSRPPGSWSLRPPEMLNRVTMATAVSVTHKKENALQTRSRTRTLAGPDPKRSRLVPRGLGLQEKEVDLGPRVLADERRRCATHVGSGLKFTYSFQTLRRGNFVPHIEVEDPNIHSMMPSTVVVRVTIWLCGTRWDVRRARAKLPGMRRASRGG